MRKFLAVLALLLAGSGLAWADGIPTVQDVVARKVPWTVTAYNNSGADISSGNVVVWDTSSASFTNSGYPYITTTTTVDDPWTAGVTQAEVCKSGTTCDIVVYGPVLVRALDALDAITINTTVGTAAAKGCIGDFTPAANKTSLGVAMQQGSGVDYDYIEVFVKTLGPPSEQ